MYEERVVGRGADEALQALERPCGGKQVIQVGPRESPRGGRDEIDRLGGAAAEAHPLVVAVEEALDVERIAKALEVGIPDEQVEVAPGARR
jgi:hypothetical protein